MPFKLIYTADLHGNKEFYERLLIKAEKEKVNAVVIGGDLCGREGSTIKEKIKNQELFLEKYMIPLFKNFKAKNKKCEFYVIMGNDDFSIMDPKDFHSIDFGPSEHREDVDFDVVLPFKENPKLVNIYNSTSFANRTLLTFIDLAEVVHSFCDIHSDDPDCQTLDLDNDGIKDVADMCPNSILDNIDLNRNQYAQNYDFGFFEVGLNNGKSKIFDMNATRGCTCRQIVGQLAAGQGHLKKGCSPSLMEEWTGVSAEEDRKAGNGKNKRAK